MEFTYVIDRTVQFREGLGLDRRVSDRVRIPVDLLAMQMNAQADATTLIQGWLRWRTQQAGDQHRPSASTRPEALKVDAPGS